MPAKYDFLEIETRLLSFWNDKEIHKKASEKNKGGESFYFLDGPPYTSGKVHVGTAWNKALKDCIIRYKRMQGFDVWDRAGYDMHGLPIEHQVTKKHNLNHKKDILEFGVEKFIEECMVFANDSMKAMNEDFIRLGVWMDFENAYRPIVPESIEAIWWLIKKVHEQKRLYEGLRTMTWCANCESALAKHELEYEQVNDTSIFLKFKIKESENEYLIIWTTTPWTIPLNLGVMVNPEVDYVKVNVEGEVWVVAKALAAVFVSGLLGKDVKIIEECKGDALEGIEYVHPFQDQLSSVYNEIKKDAPKAHTVVLSSEHVDTSAGSGLVHMAPGCGPEDFEVGYQNGIPAFNPLSESGVFPESMGVFSGFIAKTDDKKFIEEFDKVGALVTKTQIEHDYAHCWRCHNPVIYRATKQWFFKVEDLKEKMVEENKEVAWVPQAGFNAFDSWLRNLRDNSITKQRFWGTPLPVWKCESCGEFDVLASREEIKEKSGMDLERLHKPWIDAVEYDCSCGAKKKRIPDIMDVWIDPGSASWLCLHYPQEKELFDKLFPADFILEGKDQIRGWFNVLMVCSMLALKRRSFNACYMHGFVQDAQGRKMSKSLGNYIVPEEVISKYGADTFRYYTISGTKAGIDLNYNFEDMKVRFKNLGVLWNVHNYLLDLSKTYSIDPTKVEDPVLGREEKYILSRLNSSIKKATELYDAYRLDEVPKVIEDLYLELSRVYIQLIRDKLTAGSQDDKEAVIHTIYEVLSKTLSMFATIAPFICEEMYQHLKETYALCSESIHLTDWPKVDESKIDLDLESEVLVSQQVIAAVLYAREKAQRGVRWPVSEVVIQTKDESVKSFAEKSLDQIKTQTNVKEIKFVNELKGLQYKIRSDFKTLAPDFGEHAAAIIAKISQESAQTVLKNLDQKSHHPLKLTDKTIELKKEHLIIESIVPDPYIEAGFAGGFVYLSREVTDDLEAEGFSRELMRRVQSLRKNAGLEKIDEIALVVKAEDDLVKMFTKWQDAIKEKVGAAKIKISSENPAKAMANTSQEKVKGHTFEIWLEKV